MPILGMWMWPGNIAAYGADKIVSYCAAAGVTDLYFLNKGLAGTTASFGSFAPRGYDRDLLRELTDAAHRRNIRVHAWFTSASDGHYKKLHPESGRCHYKRGKDRELISLADEDYMAYMERVVAETARLYDIDGLHLDYIRYNHLLYGWDEADMKRYEQAGADVGKLRSLTERTFYGGEETCIFDAYRAGDETVRAFADCRRQDVVRFAERMISAAKSAKSGLILSAALMPEGAYDDTAFSDLHYGQNYEDAAGLYEYALPMAYSVAYKEKEAWVRRVAEGTMKRGMKTVVGLHAYGGGTGITLRNDVAAVCETQAEGVCLFREGACALACPDGKELRLFNPTDKTISRVIAGSGGEWTEVKTEIQPGEEARVRLVREADAVRVFSGEEEICVYCTQEAGR
ncbi:MAG: family 10 glycosylhydrolase [Clostridia bacterium]|nr:family 10 glycosylhydrolase [Clostridia bacterium]